MCREKFKFLMSKRDEKKESRVKTRYWMVTGFPEEPKFDKFTMTCMRVGREILSKTHSVNMEWEFVSRGTKISLGKFVSEHFTPLTLDIQTGVGSDEDTVEIWETHMVGS
jgi:hypothetical protein